MLITPPPRPERLRSPLHLKRLRTLPCSVPGCRGWPVDPHHLTHIQPKARGLKASDSLTLPLCRGHHSATSRDGVHHVGNEAAWWRAHNLDPLSIASRLWAESETPF